MKINSKSRVVVGMSGGVDSSVTALLLKQQGYDVIGLFMKNWEDDDTDEYCSSRQDLIDAVSVADTIGIPMEAVNFSREYKERVFSYFLREYQAGRTPNPDILCNSEIKFKAFLDHAMQLGADNIATGHYAQVREVDGLFQLLKADDASKDQSYFLHRLNQAQLSKAMFPLGKLLKSQVRKIAEGTQAVQLRQERQHRHLLHRRAPVPRVPQPIPADPARRHGHAGRQGGGQACGAVVLHHRPAPGTGHRRAKEASGEPWFVGGKDMANNQLIVVQGHDHPRCSSRDLTAMEMHWISGSAPDTSRDYAAKTRYRQEDAPCRIDALQDGNARDFSFDKPQWAVTPGQSVVAYDGAVCLGGGIIL